MLSPLLIRAAASSADMTLLLKASLKMRDMGPFRPGRARRLSARRCRLTARHATDGTSQVLTRGWIQHRSQRLFDLAAQRFVEQVTMYDGSRTTTRVGPTCSRATGRYGRWELKTSHSSPPGRNALPASATMANAPEESFAAPRWNGGLHATRSSSASSAGMPSARPTSTENPFASAVNAVLATAAADVSRARTSQPRPASTAATIPLPEPRSTAL